MKAGEILNKKFFSDKGGIILNSVDVTASSAEKIENPNSTTKENFVNEKNSEENNARIKSNADIHREKLNHRPEKFKFDHGTKDDELI